MMVKRDWSSRDDDEEDKESIGGLNGNGEDAVRAYTCPPPPKI